MALQGLEYLGGAGLFEYIVLSIGWLRLGREVPPKNSTKRIRCFRLDGSWLKIWMHKALTVG
jgi:hypothetical protein